MVCWSPLCCSIFSRKLFPGLNDLGHQSVERGDTSERAREGEGTPSACCWELESYLFLLNEGKKRHLKTPHLNFVTRTQMVCSGETITNTQQLGDLRHKVMDLVSSFAKCWIINNNSSVAMTSCNKTLRSRLRIVEPLPQAGKGMPHPTFPAHRGVY